MNKRKSISKKKLNEQRSCSFCVGKKSLFCVEFGLLLLIGWLVFRIKKVKGHWGLWNKLQILCDKQNKWSLFLILFFSGGGGRNRKKLVCHLVICSAWFKGQSLALFCFVLSTTITAHTCTWRFKIIFCTYFWIKELHFITEKEFFLKKGQIVGGSWPESKFL